MISEVTLAAAVPAAAPLPAAHAGVPAPIHTLLPGLQTPAPQAVQMTQTWWQLHASWFTHGIAGIFVLCCILLIVLLAVQTTKQEGLSGTIGGRVESAYRGRLGAEEQLKRLTGMIAVGFVISAFILTITGI